MVKEKTGHLLIWRTLQSIDVSTHIQASTSVTSSDLPFEGLERTDRRNWMGQHIPRLLTIDRRKTLERQHCVGGGRSRVTAFVHWSNAEYVCIRSEEHGTETDQLVKNSLRQILKCIFLLSGQTTSAMTAMWAQCAHVYGSLLWLCQDSFELLVGFDGLL